MTLGPVRLAHVNVTVPSSLETAALHFYGNVLGLKQIPKPAGPRQSIGAWYELGEAQLHLSLEDGTRNADTDRHFCCLVADVNAAETHLRANGVEIIADDKRPAANPRFFVRDPGGNLIEVAEA